MTNQAVITFLPFKIHDKNPQALSFQQQTNLADVKTQVEQKSFCQRLLGEKQSNGERFTQIQFLGQRFTDIWLFLFYAEVTKVSLNLWFKLTVTKLNFLTNSLTTLFSVLVKLNHEGRKLITKPKNPGSEILSWICFLFQKDIQQDLQAGLLSFWKFQFSQSRFFC